MIWCNRISFVFVVLALCGCPSRRVELVDKQDDQRASRPEKQASRLGRLFQLEDHFGTSDELLASVVRGDICEVRVQSRRIADAPARPDLRALKLELEDLRTLALMGESVLDLSEASKVTASIGARCGSCHQAASQRLSFPRVPVRRAEPLRLHSWGAYRMWEGLIAPSDNLWNQGASVLASAPLRRGQAVEGTEQSSLLSTREDSLHALAQAARSATSSRQRTEIYSYILASCANCHRRAGWDSILKSPRRLPLFRQDQRGRHERR